jgi:hypothetical protein
MATIQMHNWIFCIIINQHFWKTQTKILWEFGFDVRFLLPQAFIVISTLLSVFILQIIWEAHIRTILIFYSLYAYPKHHLGKVTSL